MLKADAIIYHSVNNINLNSDVLYGGEFRILKKISNGANTLYVLIKNGAAVNQSK